MIIYFKLKKNNVEIFFVKRKSKIYPNIWLRDHIKKTDYIKMRNEEQKIFKSVQKFIN